MKFFLVFLMISCIQTPLISQTHQEPEKNSKSHPILLPQTKRKYHGKEYTKEDILNDVPHHGSLWEMKGQSNYYFTHNFLRNTGEFIQIKIEKDLFLDIGLEVKKTLKIMERELEIYKIKSKMKEKIDKLLEEKKVERQKTQELKKQQNENLKELEAKKEDEEDQAESQKNQEYYKALSKVNIDDVDIFQSLSLKESDFLKGEILDRFSDGYYKIRVFKKIPYAYGPPRIVSVLALVRSEDIGREGEILSSTKLQEYHVDVSH